MNGLLTEKRRAAIRRQAPPVLIGLVPLALALWRWTLGPPIFDPVDDLFARTGLAAITLLLASLACTPAQVYLGWRWAGAWRRTLGLFAFAYATAHLAVFVALEYGFDVGLILTDGILTKPFIVLGFLAWLILLTLALTSTRGAQRRLGRRWRSLHRWVYAAGALAAVHFAWSVKDSLAQAIEWLPWALALALLLLLRWPPLRGRILSWKKARAAA